MIENSVLRRNARMQLGNNIFCEKWLMMLLYCLVISLLLSVPAMFIFTSILTILIIGPLQYGLCRGVLHVVRGVDKKANFNHIFTGFQECFSDSFLLGLLTSIFVFLWSLLLIIPGIIKQYSYALAPYIQQDSQDKSWKYALNQSKAMMDGNKGRLFLLDLSFLGWYILGTLCLGIGVLFVIPYHNMARAHFYEAVRAHK